MSHCLVRTHVNTKIMNRDWLSIALVVVQIAIVLTAALMVYAALTFN